MTLFVIRRRLQSEIAVADAMRVTTTGHGVFANEIRVTQDVESCFFSGLGLDRDFDASRLNDKQRVSRITLRVDCLPLGEGD